MPKQNVHSTPCPKCGTLVAGDSKSQQAPIEDDEAETRQESIRIVMMLQPVSVNQHRAALERLNAYVDVSPHDTLRVTYKMKLHYFQQVTRRMEAVTSILSDPDVLASVTVEELQYGQCLLQELFREVDRARELLAARADQVADGAIDLVSKTTARSA